MHAPFTLIWNGKIDATKTKPMKKSAFLFAAGLLFLFVACNPDKEFNSALLPGKWQQGTLFEHYNNNGTGHTWDESDDITEEEAQPFDWTLSKDKLTQIHLMEMGGSIPKTYTVTELTSTTLKYHDAYGKNYSFRKIN